MSNETPCPNFAAWNQETLAMFAAESYERFKQDQIIIDALREDLREAMEQCRVLLRKDNA